MKKAAFFFLAAFLTFSIFSCRREENGLRIEGISFNEALKTMSIDEESSVSLSVEPKEALHAQRIEYSLSQQGVVEINAASSSNEAVVLKAVGSGSAVVLAKVNGITDYLNVTVRGSESAGEPYIVTSVSVIEMAVGERRNIPLIRFKTMDGK